MIISPRRVSIANIHMLLDMRGAAGVTVHLDVTRYCYLHHPHTSSPSIDFINSSKMTWGTVFWNGPPSLWFQLLGCPTGCHSLAALCSRGTFPRSATPTLTNNPSTANHLPSSVGQLIYSDDIKTTTTLTVSNYNGQAERRFGRICDNVGSHRQCCSM